MRHVRRRLKQERSSVGCRVLSLVSSMNGLRGERVWWGGTDVVVLTRLSVVRYGKYGGVRKVRLG